MNLIVRSAVASSPAILLVEHAGDHERHDVALARRELLVASPQLDRFESFFACTAIALDRRANRLEQIVPAVRLGQKLEGSRFHRAHGHRDVAMPGSRR